jgi:hypothetical protein
MTIERSEQRRLEGYPHKRIIERSLRDCGCVGGVRGVLKWRDGKAEMPTNWDTDSLPRSVGEITALVQSFLFNHQVLFEPHFPFPSYILVAQISLIQFGLEIASFCSMAYIVGSRRVSTI